MLDERVDAAEAHGRGDQPDGTDDLVRVAVDLEGDHRAADARIVDAGHPRVGGQPPGQFGGVGGRRAYPDGQGGKSPQQQVAGQRMQHSARGEADLPQPPGELLVAGDHAGQHVPVSPEVLGGAVQHQPGTVFGGALEHGRGEGVVH